MAFRKSWPYVIALLIVAVIASWSYLNSASHQCRGEKEFYISIGGFQECPDPHASLSPVGAPVYAALIERRQN